MSLVPSTDRERAADHAVAEATPEGRIARLQRVNEQPWGAFFLRLAVNTLIAGALATLAFVVLTLLGR